MSADPALRLYLKRIGPEHIATMARFPGVLQEDWQEAQRFMEDGLLCPPIHRRMLAAPGGATRVLISPCLRRATVLDSLFPDTVLIAVVGMRAGDVIDHMAFDPEEPGGDALITAAEAIAPQQQRRRWRDMGKEFEPDPQCVRFTFDRQVLDMDEVMEEEE